MTPHQLRAHAELSAATAPRPDAVAKLAGRPGYPTDHVVPGQLHGAILGSPHPHARIVSIDTTEAAAMPGVVAIVTAADIPGAPHYGLRVVDRPVLCRDKVRCIADPVAAVAADTREQADAALARIRVVYEPLPLVDDAEAALAPGATPVHERGNLLHATRHRRGDLDAARGLGVHVIDATYESPRQMHAFLETEGGVAEPDGAGGWIVRFGCHNPERDRQVIAAMLAVPAGRVRVIGTPVGGSYGGKDELTVQPVAALLAWKTGRAVRLHLRRGESTDLGVKRHAMRIRMRTSCDAAGRLRSHETWVLADTGAYATHGPEVLDAAQEHAVGPYRHDAVAIDARLAYTNNGIAGAFRGFGAVQVQFALERQMDRLAQACGRDPAAFRALNLAAPYAPGPLGQVVAPFDGPARALDVVSRHPLWNGPRTGTDGRWRRGVGLALVHRSDGFGRGGPNGSRIDLALGTDGRIELRAGFTELGQNLVGAIQALAARHLGCAASDVHPVLGDSARTPDSGPVAASRATTLVWRALEARGASWRESVLTLVAARLGEPDGPLRFGTGGLWDRSGLRWPWGTIAAVLGPDAPVAEIELTGEETPSEIESAHFVFGACAALCQVAVDTWTGAVRVERLVIAAALGPVASPAGFLGQMEGGALMGIGLATTEHLPMTGGRYGARNLDSYLVPTLADTPALEVIAVENVPDGDTVGPRGAGEIGVNIATPAVANAIATALAMPVDRLPVRADDVLDFLERAPCQ